MDSRLPVERGGDRGPKIRDLLSHRPEVRRDLTIARSLGKTLVEFDRLPETERDYWVAEHEYARSTCPDCGNQLEECGDHDRLWYPYRRICRATMEREAAEAALATLHEDAPWHDGTHTSWVKERSATHPYRFDMGTTIGVTDRDLTPWDPFTTRVDASPRPPHLRETDDEPT